MTVLFRCWLKDSHEETSGCDVDDAFDAQDAASEACQRWNDGGTFAGDPMPESFGVYVRDLASRELFLVEVTPTWDVSFCADTPAPAAEPE